MLQGYVGVLLGKTAPVLHIIFFVEIFLVASSRCCVVRFLVCKKNVFFLSLVGGFNPSEKC